MENSNPNDPARNATVLLLGAEVRSGFKTVNARIDRVETRMDRLEARFDGQEKLLRAVAEQVALLVERSAR